MRLDGGVIKIKALLGVCLECLCLNPYELSNVLKMQENQLYVFDPKALHQIVVKVRSIPPDYLPSTPFSVRINTFTNRPKRTLSNEHFYFRWPSCIEI